MFCPSCGNSISDQDNFCSSCGEENKSKTPEQSSLLGKEKKKQKDTESDNTFLVSIKDNLKTILVITTLLIILIVLMGSMVYTSLGESKSGVINITKAKQKGLEVANCVDCKKLAVNGKKYPLEKKLEEEGSLRSHIINQAKKDNGNVGNLTFFHEDKNNTNFTISFDISKSTQELYNKDKVNNAQVTYPQQVINEVETEIKKRANIGDTFDITLYGPSDNNNPCNKTLSLKYISPKIKSKFIYSKRAREATIKVKSLENRTTINKDSKLRTSNLSKIMSKIEDFYISGLESEQPLCHQNTFLNQELIDIVDNHKDSEKKNIYILSNDGSFSIGDYYITPDRYNLLNQYNKGLINFGVEDILKQQPLCKNSREEFIMIGLQYKNLDFRSSIQKFFGKLLSPCRLKFKFI
ncbi:MAG: zinc ribbon domain-containing protein [Candidatus Magasanikbacteria bacterium]